jgi:hypothetical protein
MSWRILMIHDKDLTKGMVKGMAVTALISPLFGISFIVLLAFPLTWLLFQGIYNLESIEEDLG